MEPIKAKRGIEQRAHICLLCGWSEVCTESDFNKHIREAHGQFYVPRPSKKGAR